MSVNSPTTENEMMITSAEDAGMRLDRWFKLHFSGLAFGQLQKLLRSGQIRVNGARAKSSIRLAGGQKIRIPPILRREDQKYQTKRLTSNMIRDHHDFDVLRAMLLHEDRKIFIFNKPSGLAVQGGSGVNRHVDKMLESWRSPKGEKPRLVHRIDRETSGVLAVARTRGTAVKLTTAFRHRDTSKTYWALCRGVPRKREGRLSTYLRKEQTPDGDRMRVARHGELGADHAISEYRVIEISGHNLSWMELKPITGRTHQLRVHMAHIGCPIIGDRKYFNTENWQLPGGIQNKLHLHAHRLCIPHPDGGILDISAPLSPHMVQSWNLLGFDRNAR